MSFNGRTLASQANNVGSIPITRSIFDSLQRLPTKRYSPISLKIGALSPLPHSAQRLQAARTFKMAALAGQRVGKFQRLRQQLQRA